jgi:DNA-binding response OmpR family regulator
MATSALLSVEAAREARTSASATADEARSRSVVIFSASALSADLRGTILGQDDVECREAGTAAEAMALMEAGRPDLLVVDARSAGAEKLVAAVRANPVTRPMSIVVVAAGDFHPSDLHFIVAGANAMLRPPAGPEWDERLTTLLHVPPRREARLAVLVQYQVAIYEAVQSVGGTALNVSENGILLETDVPIPVGVDVDLRIHLGDGRPTPLIGCGQLVRHEAARRSGVRFYGLEHDGMARLRHFVRRH